jgi:hypothetical protein
VKIEKEDFDAWRDNIVTQAVFAHVKALVEQAKEKWLHVSWEGGTADPLMLADLRARAEIASDLVALTFEDMKDE